MDDFVETTADNGGVHINPGIPNRAFVLAALELGGNAWESVGQVWYDVLTGDIKADCDFATFAALTIAAAKAVDAETHTAVSNAWQGVGWTRRRRAPHGPASAHPHRRAQQECQGRRALHRRPGWPGAPARGAPAGTAHGGLRAVAGPGGDRGPGAGVAGADPDPPGCLHL